MNRHLRPIFATKQPLLIAGVREVLLGARIMADPQVIDSEELAGRLKAEDRCLVILDGETLPRTETLAELCRRVPRSLFVVWTVRPTAELLQLAVECGVHGLLSTRLPLEEASRGLHRICQGERLFRFDTDPGPLDFPRPLQLSGQERHVLSLLNRGRTNGEIASMLQTTEGTVKVCLSRMFRKTGTHTRHELVLLDRSGVLLSEQPKRPPAAPQAFDAQWMLQGSELEGSKV